jgi:molybdopterin-guanine dinucleotide biosynthesis protein A
MGAVLAGGAGRRIGGSKAVVRLGGRPLILYPARTMSGVVGDVTIVAKSDTVLPAAEELDGIRVLTEPDEPRHPLVGIVHALAAAGGRPVLICAGDMPFVTAAALAELARADPGGTPAVIAAGADGSQPLLGCYQPEAASLLAAAAREATASMRATVAALGPRMVELSDPWALFNVNSAEDLARAEARLAAITRT